MRASEFVDHIKDMIREYGDLPILVEDAGMEVPSHEDLSITFPYYTGSGPTYFIVTPKYNPASNKEEDDGN